MMSWRVLLTLVALTGQADAPRLDDLLARVAHYVQQFEQGFEIILSDEQYEQKDVVRMDARSQSSKTRKIRSEMLFVWEPEQEKWLTVRNVLAVDGVAVPDSRNRLTVALAESGPDRLPWLRRLRDEGARFNIGGIFRNFSDPTLVLQFLDEPDQPRFTFTITGTEKVAGVNTWKLAFSERTRPTVIQSATSDLPSNGFVWIDGATGSVVRTSLTLMDPETNVAAEVTVDYRLNPKLSLWVPLRLVEHYTQQRFVNRAPPGSPPRSGAMSERIEGVATYSNFRRFETEARIVP